MTIADMTSPGMTAPGLTAPGVTTRASGSTPRARGFTLVECLVTCALVGVFTTLALPSYQSYELRAGRLDAVDALTRIQVAQEQHRAHHGGYAQDLAALRSGAAPSAPGAQSVQSGQGRYLLALHREDAESYTATATARGTQAKDPDCSALTLQVVQGFVQTGPDAKCWNR